jgi:hypothetical protein
MSQSPDHPTPEIGFSRPMTVQSIPEVPPSSEVECAPKPFILKVESAKDENGDKKEAISNGNHELYKLKFGEIDMDSAEELAAKYSCLFGRVSSVIRSLEWLDVIMYILEFVIDILLLLSLFKFQDKRFFAAYAIYFLLNYLYMMKRVVKGLFIRWKGSISATLVNPTLYTILVLKHKKYATLMALIRNRMPISVKISLFAYRRLSVTFQFFICFYNFFLINNFIPPPAFGPTHTQGAQVGSKLLVLFLRLSVLTFSAAAYPFLIWWINYSKKNKQPKPQPSQKSKRISIKAYTLFHIDRALNYMVSTGDLRTLKPVPIEVHIVESPSFVVSSSAAPAQL